ncbi:MAG: hypothetical protein ACRECR_01840, partial [Thermoplasmata archaeon]
MREIRRIGPDRRVAAGIVLLVLLFLLSSYGPSMLSGPTRAGTPSGTLLAAPAKTLVAPAGSVHSAAFTCNAANYAWVGTTDYTLAPPYPDPNNFVCALNDPTSPAGLFHDEVHANFASSVPGSGSRAAFPLILPPDTVSGGIQSIYDGFDVGMVVTGDNQSLYGQSFAEVSFLGSASAASYDVVVSVWSVHLSAACPSTAAFEFTWNNSTTDSFACMTNLLGTNGDEIATGVDGGVLLNVTFAGNATNGSSLTIYFNDSAQSIADSVALTTSMTGVGPMWPAYSAACEDYCVLNWSAEPMGLGFGADLCDTGSCYSYDETTLNSTDPLVLDAPLFYGGSGYGGQYSTFSPMSLSGACSGIAASGITCPTAPSLGYYPEFTFNGSQLNFPTQKPWATENFGANFQYQGTGGATDFIPLFLDSASNSSQGGFLPPDTGLTVTARAQVLGTISNMAVNYTLPDGSSANLNMTLRNGTSSDGFYRATLPASTENGRIQFRILSTDRAGDSVELPVAANHPFYAVTGPLPNFTLALTINAGSCGSVSIDGSVLTNGQSLSIEPGTYPLSATEC